MIELDILCSSHTYAPSTQSTTTKTYRGSSVVNAYSNKCNSLGLLP